MNHHHTPQTPPPLPIDVAEPDPTGNLQQLLAELQASDGQPRITDIIMAIGMVAILLLIGFGIGRATA